MKKRLELLIERARSESLNKEYSTSIGIPQEDFESFANEAQDRAFSEVVKTPAARIFHKIKTFAAVAQQESYALPADCYEGKIALLEYSPDGNAENYYPLDRLTNREKIGGAAGDPGYYLIVGQQIIVMARPASSNGIFRMTYVQKPKRLALRRAKVGSLTFVAPTLSALTLSATDIATNDPGSELAKYNYLSLVDRDGEQVMAGVEYDSINTSTGVVSLTGSSFTAQTGEAVSTSDYAVIGKDAANVSSLPESCDRYLIKWMAACALERDGSALDDKKRMLSNEMLEDLISSFADSDHDVTEVPIISIENLGYWDDGR